MSEDSSQKYPDGFVSICTVPREIGKILYADRWPDIAKSLQRRDDLGQEYAAALEDGADPAAVKSISSRLSAAKTAVRPGWVRHLIEADRLMTSDALPLYRYRRDDLPHPVARDCFAGNTDQHVRTRQLMLLTGKIASDLVIVLERDLREALRHIQSPIKKKREHVIKKIANADRSAAEDHQWQPKGLTPQQKSARDELKEAMSELQWWSGNEPEDEEEKHHQQTDRLAYKRAITRAVRAGLWQHPVVREWLAARRSLGDWEGLRRFRLCLESGVTKTMSKADFWLAFEAGDLIDDGMRPKAICKILIDKLKDPEPEDLKKWRDYFDLRPEDVESLIARLGHSRQNFYQWLKRLRLI